MHLVVAAGNTFIDYYHELLGKPKMTSNVTLKHVTDVAYNPLTGMVFIIDYCPTSYITHLAKKIFISPKCYYFVSDHIQTPTISCIYFLFFFIYAPWSIQYSTDLLISTSPTPKTKMIIIIISIS